jgi:CheY-like chemotaxis protein
MGSPGRILLVEDDIALRDALAELLREEGYRVDCASNGSDALRHLAADAPPSVILLDLSMPVMNGWEFRNVQRHDPRYAGIPTIVLSATHGSDDDARFADLAADAFLAKPFDADRLIDAIQRLC